MMTKVQRNLCKVIHYHKTSMRLSKIDFFRIKTNSSSVPMLKKKEKSLEAQQREFLQSLNILFFSFSESFQEHFAFVLPVTIAFEAI